MNLRIDWTRCEARGHCVELLPEVLVADDWGYPLSDTGSTVEIPMRLLELAEAAVRSCPRHALSVQGERR